MLSKFKLSDAVKIEKAADSLGGGSFILESNIYPFKVDIAYIDKSSFGSTTLEVRYEGVGDNKKSYRESIPLTDNDGNFEVKDKDGTLRPYYGFTKANALLQVLIGKELHEVETREAVVKLYDFNAKAEVQVPREVLTELKGLPVQLGITKNVNNKKVLVGKEWKPDPTGAIKEVNKTHTAFRYVDMMTAAEIERDATEAKFKEKWLEKFEGTTQGKVVPVAGGAVAGVPGAAAPDELKFDV